MKDIYDLAIVGAGLSALSTLNVLSTLHTAMAGERIVILDYQHTPGGFLHPALPAPGFEDAWALIQMFRKPQGTITYFGATAVGLLPAPGPGEPQSLVVRLRQGTVHLHAQRVLIASGGLEVTREHAQIPGTRPAGVITPVMVHQLLSRGYLPGRQVVVYGSARYAALTARRLANAGVKVTLVASTSGDDQHGELPVELVEIMGFPRLECVKLRRGDQFFALPADTLVYAAGMIANTHWLRGSGVGIGPGGAIQVDAQYQTNVPGIFAMGTVVAPSLDHAASITMGKEVASLLAGGFL
jgi:thioredoxin reductase